jgi:Histidine kinase
MIVCSPSKPSAWLRDTLREWSWSHTAIGLLLGSLALFNMGALLFYSGEFNVFRAWVYNVLEFGMPGVLAMRMADRAAADGVPRVLAYGVGLVGVIVLGIWVIGPLLFPLIGGEADWNSRNDVMLAFSLLLPLSLCTVAYAHWRRGSETLQRVQGAEVARAREEQLLQSARLLALQARVEPQLLFDTLQRVRDGISTSAEAAEHLLADLSALLRALQPAVGATASTVERELSLVQAYARVANAAALLPPRLQMHAEPSAATAPLVPMVLLPALRSLVGDAPAGAWRVHASTAGARLRIRISPSAPDWTTQVAMNSLSLAALQGRAHAVHGSDARLQVQMGDHPSVLIDLPLPDDEPTRPDR